MIQKRHNHRTRSINATKRKSKQTISEYTSIKAKKKKSKATTSLFPQHGDARQDPLNRTKHEAPKRVSTTPHKEQITLKPPP